MSVAAKYDLAATLVKVMTDPSAAIADLHALAVDLKGKVDAIDSATSTDSERVNPLEVKYGKDEAGKEAAESFLREDGGVFDSIVDYIDEDAGRTFHVLNATLDLLVKFLRIEADFHKSGLVPKSAQVSRKGEYKADFNEVRELIRNVAGMAEATGWDAKSCNLLDVDSAGKFKSILPGFRGTKSAGEDGPVTGRYAKVYALAWNIDGEDAEWRTIADIVRILWTGADRIGKNTKSLTDILDNETDWTDPKFETATFDVNGHVVTVTRTTDGE